MSEAWIEIDLCTTGGVFGCVGMSPEFRLDGSASNPIDAPEGIPHGGAHDPMAEMLWREEPECGF